MAKTILIPTDLQVASLSPLRACLEQGSDTGLRVLLLHAFQAPGGITDLLFHSPERALAALVEPRFREAMAIIRNRFEHRIEGMELLPFHGRSQSAFDAFLEEHAVDEVHFSAAYSPKLHRSAFDPRPFVRGAQVRAVAHDTFAERAHATADGLQLLFER